LLQQSCVFYEREHQVKVMEPAQPQPPNKPEKKKVDEPGFGEQFAEFTQFLKDTWIEFRRISWPTRQQVIKETWSVLVLVTMLTVAVLAFDFGIARVVFEPLDKFAKKAGGGVGGGQTQTWGPLTPRPGAPVDNPSMPGNALPNENPAKNSLPANSQGTSGAPAPVPAPAPQTPNNQ
jgi:preprotein translocase SecE subunit